MDPGSAELCFEVGIVACCHAQQDVGVGAVG